MSGNIKHKIISVLVAIVLIIVIVIWQQDKGKPCKRRGNQLSLAARAHLPREICIFHGTG